MSQVKVQKVFVVTQNDYMTLGPRKDYEDSIPEWVRDDRQIILRLQEGPIALRQLGDWHDYGYRSAGPSVTHYISAEQDFQIRGAGMQINALNIWSIGHREVSRRRFDAQTGAYLPHSFVTNVVRRAIIDDRLVEYDADAEFYEALLPVVRFLELTLQGHHSLNIEGSDNREEIITVTEEDDE